MGANNAKVQLICTRPRRGSGDVPAVGSSGVLERHSGPASLHRAALHAPCAAVKRQHTSPELLGGGEL